MSFKPDGWPTVARIALAALLLVAARGDSAESTSPTVGPRVVFSAEQCEKIDASTGRWRLNMAPYWTPTVAQVRAFEVALFDGKRRPKKLQWPPEAYGYQYFGVTDDGTRQIYVSAFCPAFWEDNSARSSWNHHLVRALHGSRCFFTLLWNPSTAEFSSPRYSSSGR